MYADNMAIVLVLNRLTSMALAFLLGLSLRFLSLHQVAFLLIPFLIVTDAPSIFLVNIALMPLALLLLVISSLIYGGKRLFKLLRA